MAVATIKSVIPLVSKAGSGSMSGSCGNVPRVIVLSITWSHLYVAPTLDVGKAAKIDGVFRLHGR